MVDNYSQELEVAILAVTRAARLCQAVQKNIADGVLDKNDRSPVTVADFGSQAMICKMLGEAFPEDPIVAEEDSQALRLPENAPLSQRVLGHVQDRLGEVSQNDVYQWIDRGGAKEYSRRFWTLDPIDGTKGFLRQAQYAIALALIVDGQIQVAVVGCPNLPQSGVDKDESGNLFWAIRGEGAFQRTLEGNGGDTRVHVSHQSDLTQIRFCESVEAAHSSHSDAARIAASLGIQAEPVRLDSQTKYGVVARGDAEAYLRLPKSESYREKIWDHAGGYLVVEEAGGRVTDIFGKPLDFSHGYRLVENRGVIVTNGLVHDAILETIATLEIGR